MMNRRTFLCGLTLGTLAAPLAADGQQAGKVYRVGYLGTTPPTPQTAPIWDVFLSRLRELGYVEGRNIVLERHYSEGHNERYPALAAELVQLKVDVIIAAATPAARAAKDATATTPIVTVLVGDPVGSGLVASLARPGGNVTGMSSAAKDISGKQLELLKELVPGLSRVAVIWTSTISSHVATLKELEVAAKSLRVQVRAFDVQTLEDLEGAFTAITRERPEGLIPFDGPLPFVQRRKIVEFAAQNRMATGCLWRTYTEVGCLMSYGPSISDLFYRAATYVDKILKGAKPADLPVQQPTKFELVINMKMAKALGLTIPPSLLLRADEVIQ